MRGPCVAGYSMVNAPRRFNMQRRATQPPTQYADQPGDGPIREAVPRRTEHGGRIGACTTQPRVICRLATGWPRGRQRDGHGDMGDRGDRTVAVLTDTVTGDSSVS